MKNFIVPRTLDLNRPFRLGDYISEGFNLFGKNISGFFVYGLIYVLIVCILAFIPFLGQLASIAVNPALIVGFYVVANKIAKGEMTQFNDFFKGFDNVGQLCLTSVVSSLLIVAGMIPFVVVAVSIGGFSFLEYQNSGDFNFSPVYIVLLLLTLIPVIYLGIAYSWAAMFVVFHKLEFWDALEASRKVISKRWFSFFLFMIVTGLISVLGFLGLGIGIFFTFPAVMCMHYAAFADITALNEEEEEMEMDIKDHLIV